MHRLFLLVAVLFCFFNSSLAQTPSNPVPEAAVQKVIVVGGDFNYPPFEFIDSFGKPAGYNIDLVNAIAEEMGLRVTFQLGPWSEIVKKLDHGQIDMLSGMFYSSERDKKYDFSHPHSVNHYVCIVRRGSGAVPKNLQELKGKKVIIQNSDAIHDYLLSNGFVGKITLANSQEEMLAELAAGLHDCAIAVRLSAHFFIQRNGWKNLEPGQASFVALDYCFAVKEGRKQLLAEFNEGLRVLEEKGLYRKIYEKWLGVFPEQKIDIGRALKSSLRILGPLFIILLVAFIWSWTLKLQVDKKTCELRESIDKFKYFFDAANVGKSLTLPDGRMHPNPAFAQFLGYSVEELDGCKWQDFTPKEDVSSLKEKVEAMLLGKTDSARFEQCYFHKNGDLVWGDVNTKLRRDNEGNPMYFVTTIVDISERKRAEEALRHSEERFRLFAEAAPIGIVISDKDEKAVYASRRFSEMFGYSLADIPDVGTWMQLAYPDTAYREEVFKTWKDSVEMAAVSKSEIGPLEFSVTCKNGSVKKVQFRLAQQSDLNFILFTDVTEQRKLEKQLLQAQKMEAVGRLAGGVAHDYNNMLAIILGYTEILADKVKSDQTLKDGLEEINKAAQRSADITRKLLAFARQQAISPRCLDLNEIITGMHKMLRRLIGEEVELEWSPARDLWQVKIDPSQIDQILVNLCVNARDAIKGHGRISIALRNVSLTDADCSGFESECWPGDFVMLSVSDDGCGINQEIKSNIFEPFFSTKGVNEGTGLGLATIFGIVEQNNGFIEVESKTGSGSTFSIYLPRYLNNDEEKQAEIKADTLPGKGETILLVEDEPPLLLLFTRMLEKIGYKVLAADAPSVALKLADEVGGNFNVLITDVVMPEMTGKQLNAEICRLYPHVKTLFVSGYTANEISERGVLDEGFSFLQKPIKKNELAQRLREIIEGVDFQA